MQTLIKYGLTALIAAVSGAYLARTYYPRVETKEVEKIVTKKDIITKVVEVTKADGSKTTETVTIDKSAVSEAKSTSVSAAVAPNWHLTIGAERASLMGTDNYRLTLERRILGPFSAGISVTSERSIGLIVGMEF